MTNKILKSSFHEKLKMLLVLLGVFLVSINQVWAGPTINKGNVYFVAGADWEATVQMVSRQGNNYSYCWTFDNVPNTKLYYKYINGENSGWSLASYYFMANASGWNTGTWSYPPGASNYTSENTSYGIDNQDGWYLVTTANSPSWLGTNISPKDNSNLKKNQTVNIKVDGSTPAKAPAKIELASYYMSTNPKTTTGSSNTIAVNATTVTTTYTAVIGAKVTLTMSDKKTGYIFDGWYNGNTLLSTDNPYEYWGIDATTVTAKFSSAYTGLSASANPSSAASTGYPTISATEVKQGSSVNVAAGSPKTGFAWDKWTSSNGTFGNATNASTTFKPNANNATAVANFTEYKSSITIQAGSNGSVSNSGTWSLGVATTKSSTATANNGYYFTSWSKSGNAALSTTSSATTIVKGDGTNGGSGTATANFAKRWVLRGSRPDGSTAEGMPSWTTTTADMTVSSGTSTKTVTLLPNRKYKYMIYDKKPTAGQKGCKSSEEASATQPWNTEWTLDGTNPVYFSTKGYGTYTFSVVVGTNDKPAVTISGPTSHTISMGTITWSEGVATPAASAGGTNTAKTTENSVDYAITNGQYICDGGTAVFTAAANAGYQFMGWFNKATYNPATQEPISVENPYTVSNITENKTVYALFKEIVFDVTVKLDGTTPTTLKVGKVSHPSITASVPTGKVFDRWVITGSATVDDSANPTTTITGASDNQSTVTATFKDLPKIYIDLNAATDWRPSNMYVYFYSGGYWDSSNGTGANSGGTLIKANCPMTKITGTNIWYCEYNPNASPFAGKTITHVTFSDQSRTSGYFNSCTAVYRTDFDACMNMFVLTDNTYTKYNSQNCAYRNTNQISGDANKGYWRNYGEKNSGFYLNNLNGGSFEFTNEDGGNTYSTLVNLEKNKTYYFYIGGCGGQNWSNNQGTYPFNTNNRTRNVIKYNDVSSDGNRCKLTTTEAGYYTFKLTPSNTAAQMSVTIDFPINSGDYRATVTHSGKEFPSNTIKSGMSSGTISLYLKQGSNTLSIQKYNGTKWVQQITRTVSPSKNGVYTMTLTCNNASSTVSTPEAYEGEFYIRTDCAPGGWRDYTENKMTYNELTFSESDATTFDYYFCKWISSSGYNVRFVVGNEINMAISDTLIHDAALGSGTEEVLPAPANVRFSYNSFTNEVKRAYISGATNPNDRFLIMHTNNKVYTSTGAAINYHSTYSNLIANEAYFFDRNNWVYYVELQAQHGSTAYLTAHYNGADRDLYGSSGSPKPVLTSSNTTTKYNILVTYDFKTNNLLTAWHPGANATVNDNITSIPSVMFIRKHQEQADQVTIGTGSVAPSTIYGVMKFNKYILNNQSESGEHAPTSLSATERDLYWISFPFDVNLSDVFGFGEYGKHWIIEEYDGAERAAKGYWKDSPGFWKFVTDRSGKVLKKGKGYVLALDLDELRISSDIWNNNVTDVYLYFPSTEKLSVENVKASDITEVPAHTCTINRQKPGDVYDINKNRTIADSHWNLIGVPLFANSTGFTFSANYYYAWNCATNTYSTESATTGTLQTMQAYMVQFAGTLDWYSHTTTNAIVGRRAMADNLHFAEFKLDLMQGEESLDHAFVRLSDEDEVTTNFEFGYDLCKEFNGGKANIYTIAENYIPVAGNCLPLSLSQTTSVPLGVRIESEGEYIFSIPEGTSGVGVTLIDNETGTRTNLGLTDYSVTLTTGDHNNRFVLEISPIEHTTTAIENSEKTDAPNNVCKKLIDGVLYIIKDGKVFDARGARLQ